MKIISNYRDYYDHLVGKYGFDETMVYDRRGDVLSDPFKSWQKQFNLSICGHYYPCVTHGGKIFFDESPALDHCDNNFIRYGKGQRSQANVKFRQPILIESSGYKTNAKNKREWIDWYQLPILSHFKIPSIIDADEMYQRIYAFLGWLKDNPEPPNNQTNKEKIVAHGFDAKTSFRPKMKLDKI